MAYGTYAEMQAAAARGRLDATADAALIADAIRQAHTEIWEATEEWSFRRVSTQTLAVTQGDATPTLASEADRILEVYDDNGVMLAPMTPDDFDSCFRAALVDGETGRPWAYKMGRTTTGAVELTLGPTPDAAYTFTYSYLRVESHLADGTTLTVGPMDSANDTPLWPARWNYVLVHRARAIGLAERGHPNLVVDQQLYEQGLALMQRALRVDVGKAKRRFPRDPL